MKCGLGRSPDVAKKVRAIIAGQAMVTPVDLTPDTRLSDLGLDSLGLVECLFSLEETFDITVPFNANEPEKTPFDLSTVGTVIDGVEALIATR